MDKCVICGEEAGVLYSLLPGGPAFCSEHHNPRDAGPFGCDFTGPDDFDIPFDDCDVSFAAPLPPVFDRKAFVWTDREGVRHRLVDIDDVYLTNIVNFLDRRLFGMDRASAKYWSAARSFLFEEAKLRGVEVFCG